MIAVLGSSVLAPITSTSNTDLRSYLSKKISTSIVLTPEGSENRVGTNVHIDGMLNGTSGISDAKVGIKIIPPNGTLTYPVQGPTVYTTNDGRFDFDFIPCEAGSYYLITIFSGTVKYSLASKSMSLNVEEALIPEEEGPQPMVKSSSLITLTGVSSTVDVGIAVRADGLLSSGSGIAGANVDLQIVLPDGTMAVPDQGAQSITDADGTFSIDHTPVAPGTYRYIATFAGNDIYNASEANVTFVAEMPVPSSKARTSLSLTGDASVLVGGTEIVTGTLLDDDGKAITGATVTAYTVRPNGVQTASSNFVLDANGQFTITYRPSMEGVYVVYASYAGDDSYESSSDSMSFAVSSPPIVDDDDDDAKYTITSSGSTYTATDANDNVLTSGSNAATVIQYALDRLTSGRTVQEKVLLKGQFVLTTSIKPSSYTTIELEGKATTSSTSITHMIYASGKSFVTIEGGEWDNNMLHTIYSSDGKATGEIVNPNGNPNGGLARDAFFFESCNNVLVQNLKVHSSPFGNMEFLSCSYCTLYKVESYDSGDMYTTVNADRGISIIFAYCSNCVVDSCYIHDSARGGCYFYTEDDGSVQSINNNVFRNNRVERTECSGLSLSTRGKEDICNGGLIENNTLVDCGMDGVHPMINVGYSDSSGARFTSNVIVRDNLCYETGTYHASKGSNGGIFCSSHDGLVTRNEVRNITDFGMLLYGDRITASYNKIDQPKTLWAPAIVIVDSNYAEVVYNEIYDRAGSASRDSIVVYGPNSYNHIAFNHIENSVRYAVDISASSCVGNIVEGNDIVGSGTIHNVGTSTVVRNNT
ncbi:MAG: hypothetical protein GXX95_02990 [Methanomassiliicoccus sp.]|nr:hypothetical protein [Methanomassiliicoccus sp.]